MILGRIPMDSADARELRETERDAAQLVLHDPRCTGGWLGETDDGHPIPCLECRPHLRDQLDRRRGDRRSHRRAPGGH